MIFYPSEQKTKNICSNQYLRNTIILYITCFFFMNLLIIIRPIYVVYAIKNICCTYNETHCDLKTYIFFLFCSNNKAQKLRHIFNFVEM